LVEFGEVRRGILGVRGRDLNHEIASALELKVSQGAFVSEVVEGSAAAEAGIQSGDVIISVNNERIRTFADLIARVGTVGAGKQIEIGVLRDGKERQLQVTLRAEEREVIAAELHPALAGATLAANDQGGVSLTELEQNSMAARYGLRKDDVIVAVNRRPVNSVAELRQAMDQAGNVIALNIRRGNTSLYLVLRG
jgi:S1-C subfamily serine protease